MAVDKKINPTLTLAQLYDAQKQFFDSFIIYQQLYQQNPTEDLKNRLQNAHDKIFTDNSLSYNDITNTIFNEEDKIYFKLIPDTQYKEYKKAIHQIENDEIEFTDEDFDEDELEMEGAEQIESEFIPDKPADRPKIESIKQEQSNDNNFLYYTISEFSEYIISKLGSDKKLSMITLSELKEIKLLFKDIL